MRANELYSPRTIMPPGPCKSHDPSKCSARIWSVVQYPRRIDHVKVAFLNRAVQVGLDELHLIES